MNVKTSAHYQREYRRRLREQGLVKKEIWILPEHADTARAVEKELRARRNNASESGKPNSSRVLWRTGGLYDDLLETRLVRSGRASVELIDGVDPTLVLTMSEFGDLPVFINVAGEQIIAEAVLWLVSDVTDTAAFNEVVLRTHKYFPLSTICTGHRADDEYYLMFGALGSECELIDIVHEVEVLASNVIHATEAYSEFLKPGPDHTGEVK